MQNAFIGSFMALAVSCHQLMVVLYSILAACTSLDNFYQHAKLQVKLM